MNEISIVTFKWRKPSAGYKLKSPVDYSAEHVNVLYRAVKRNTTLPFKFICVTDDFTGIDKEIHTIELWDKYKNLGGCYNRLYIFSDEIRNILGNRFICIDLDCVIVNNIDSILSRQEDFIINKFLSKGGHNQLYNGGLIMMNAGARQKVWQDFNPVTSLPLLDKLRNEQHFVGSDQAWIQASLGNNELMFDDNDGVYDFSFLPERRLPENAKMIFFPGKVDPSQEKNNIDWIARNWI